ncbi:L,D-transpeptidase [uncultured Polaribacter sp.]|uniref:L,D-transpeptidase n=1 Tax=uncultured Polaribacter sp. TaxID=174711 RepID=UPI0026042143|nr:L,D-transpeptidase [uncultured Polaribacter sp.]
MHKKGQKFFIVLLLLTTFVVGYTTVFSFLKNEKIVVDKTITIGNYFSFLDSIVLKYNAITPYNLTEHLLVRANPWIIDTLQNTDYYIQKAKGRFVYDQKKMVVLNKGDHLILPDAVLAKKIIESFQKTSIDINIPAFKLRIFEDGIERFEFPIRVGKDEKKYLEMSGRVQDLKTKTGKGKIVAHVRNPRYVNPVTNHEYFVTNRDDKRITKLPQIPFIETEINGLRYGQLIHPTTNPVTLGKAYSNGCIGTREGDAWVIYYYAPIGTKINIRYDLNVKSNNGEAIVLKDIYGYFKN